MLKTLFIGCAGAGSNIVAALKENLPSYGFVSYVTIDTSHVNRKNDVEFVHIKEDSNGENLLTGSGGIRGTNLNDIKTGVVDFINEKRLHNFDGIIYLVFSSNGGSGNVIASVLLRELLKKDIAVGCIVVHDTTSKQYAGQALDTIKSINKICKDTNKAVAMLYYLNEALAVEKVNETIINEVKMLLEYNDIDSLEDIDAEDMKNFYRPMLYNKLDLPAGIYGATATKFGDLSEIVKKHDIVIGRCLVNSDVDPFKEHYLPQYKKGRNIKTENESILLLINNFEKHFTILNNAYKQYDKTIEMFEIEDNDDSLDI